MSRNPWRTPSWVIVAIALGTACTKSQQLAGRSEVLEAMGREVVLPGYERMAASANRLVSAARALRATPSDTALANARGAWRETLASLGYTYAARMGPITELRFHMRAAIWPIRPSRIDALADEVPADDPILEHAGVALKGMFALEYLLFERPGDGGHLLSSPKRQALLVLLAEDFERLVNSLKAAALNADLPKQLAKMGQDGVGLLVNSMLETVETSCVTLDRAFRFETTTSIAGGRSDSIAAFAQAKFRGVRDYYLLPEGHGLSSLVVRLSPAVDRSVRGALDAAIDTLAVIPQGSEARTTRSDVKFSRAYDACRALDRAMKTGLLGTLGVSLIVWQADGD